MGNNARYWRHSAKRKKLIGKYKSVLEAKFAADMEAKGIEFRYEPETLEYRTRVVRGMCDACEHDKVSQRRTYLPDFVIDIDGSGRVYIETKGRLTSADRTKMVAVKRDHPELDIRMVFGSNNKLKKNNERRYSDWAADNGFQCGFGAIVPPEWVEHLGGSQRVGEPVRGDVVPGDPTVDSDAGTALHHTDNARRKHSERGRKSRQRKGGSAPVATGPVDPDSEGT